MLHGSTTASSPRSTTNTPTSPYFVASIHNPRHPPVLGPVADPGDMTCSAQKVDKLSRQFFPLTFVVFNLVYWIYYTASFTDNDYELWPVVIILTYRICFFNRENITIILLKSNQPWVTLQISWKIYNVRISDENPVLYKTGQLTTSGIYWTVKYLNEVS